MSAATGTQPAITAEPAAATARPVPRLWPTVGALLRKELLAPVDRSALLFAKATTLFAYLIVLELVAVPAFSILLLGPSIGPALPWLVVTLVLADIGVAVIGTLVAGIAVRTRARDLLGPLLALPLLVPIVIGASRCTEPLLVAAHRGTPAARWLATLGVYDLIFGLIAYALFDFLLED